jgi:hypothetical protein
MHVPTYTAGKGIGNVFLQHKKRGTYVRKLTDNACYNFTGSRTRGMNSIRKWFCGTRLRLNQYLFRPNWFVSTLFFDYTWQLKGHPVQQIYTSAKNMISPEEPRIIVVVNLRLYIELGVVK